jgi:hypothetical protein
MSLKNLLKAIKEDQRVSPRVQMWLSKGGDLTLTDNTAKLITLQTTTEPRERSGSFSSSSRGNCHRQQALGYLGAETSPRVDTKLQNIFLDGHWRHLRWQALLLEIGVLTHMEVPWDMPHYRLKGTLDGVNINEGWGFELKGANDNSYKGVVRNGPMHSHLMQIHTYMLGTGLKEFALIYENKNTNEFTEFTIHEDDEIMAEVIDELVLLNDGVSDKELPPMLTECQITPDYQCRYRDVCPSAVWP